MTEPFKAPSQTIRIPNGIASIGGPDLLMPVGDKLMKFEMHNYFGPMPLNRKGEEMRRVPLAFYKSLDRWVAGGKLVDGITCVVPDECHRCHGEGVIVTEVISRRSCLRKTCPNCNGTKIVAIQRGPQ